MEKYKKLSIYELKTVCLSFSLDKKHLSLDVVDINGIQFDRIRQYTCILYKVGDGDGGGGVPIECDTENAELSHALDEPYMELEIPQVGCIYR